MKGRSFFRLPAVSMLGIFVAISACELAARELAEEFRATKSTIQRQLRSHSAEDRAQAIRQLKEFPLLEAAKLAVQVGFKDESSDVRAAMYETLPTFGGDSDTCRYMLDVLSHQARRNELNERSAPLLATLLTARSKDVEDAVSELLDKTLDNAKTGPLLITELADQLGSHSTDENVALLTRLSESKVFANHFGPRRAVVWALIKIDRLESLGSLVELLRRLDGEARVDVIRYLTSVTGKKFSDDAPAWSFWWKKNKETYVMPAAAARMPVTLEAIRPAETSYYYGLPIYARRMVFVMDTSGSMSGFRLDAAKRELIYAINHLPEEARFSVVVFNSEVAAWQKTLMKATDSAKKSAAAFVLGQVAQSNTASFDALEAAFHFDAEAIYFLSDGAPHGGKVADPQQIVHLIAQMNRPRRESIYTIGIGPGLPGGPLEVFLHALAEQNLGIYRRVDQ